MSRRGCRMPVRLKRVITFVIGSVWILLNRIISIFTGLRLISLYHACSWWVGRGCDWISSPTASAPMLCKWPLLLMLKYMGRLSSSCVVAIVMISSTILLIGLNSSYILFCLLLLLALFSLCCNKLSLSTSLPFALRIWGSCFKLVQACLGPSMGYLLSNISRPMRNVAWLSLLCLLLSLQASCP